MENESMHLLPDEQLESIYSATKNTKRDGNSHLKHLLTSICHSLAKNEVEAINDLHKYFDYNMRQKQTRQNTETGSIEFVAWAVKVHQSAVNLANLHFRLGHLDESLLSVMESIKISQIKNDHESILQCLIWLQ